MSDHDGQDRIQWFAMATSRLFAEKSKYFKIHMSIDAEKNYRLLQSHCDVIDYVIVMINTSKESL